MCAELGSKVRAVAKKHGVNVQTMAGAIKPPVNDITVQRWLDGEVNKIPFKAIVGFARAHGMSICKYLAELGYDCNATP